MILQYLLWSATMLTIRRKRRGVGMTDDPLMQARKRAERAVEGMEDGPLKIAAFQAILAKLLSDSDSPTGRVAPAKGADPPGSRPGPVTRSEPPGKGRTRS